MDTPNEISPAYKNYIPSDLYKWVTSHRLFTIDDVYLEYAVINGWYRTVKYLINGSNLLDMPAKLAQKPDLSRGSYIDYQKVTRIDQGGYNFLHRSSYDPSIFCEAVSFEDKPYYTTVRTNAGVTMQYVPITVKMMAPLIISRYGNARMMKLVNTPIETAVAMCIFYDNMEVLRFLEAKYPPMKYPILVGYARTYRMMHHIMTSYQMPKSIKDDEAREIFTLFCRRDDLDMLEAYFTYVDATNLLREMLLEVSCEENAKRVMKRYIVGVSEAALDNAIRSSLITPGVCADWFWKHEHDAFVALVSQNDTISLDGVPIEGIIWLMERGFRLSEGDMLALEEAFEDHEFHPEGYEAELARVRELYSKQK